ncbi:MAG TPA: PBP1A family penicillin-binding protein [Virgibacillus sp.]|nr:PBP1A family penicillin-binding protein [Virgibacillus sp.]
MKMINRLYKKLLSIPKTVRWVSISIIFIVMLGLIGYMFILFGGRLVVDEQALILDATTTVETVDGDVIYELYNENRIPIDANRIPQHVKDAFVSIEDRRFYKHAGVDFRSVVRAVYRDIIALDKVEGASTITQQLAKNLFLSNDKTWMRKTKEAMAAIYLEREFSKDKILELYLNAIYFGHGVYGIEAASQKFFSKSIEDVTIAEGALLAGIVNAPNSFSPINHPEQAMNRRNLVLQAMEDIGVLSTKKRLQEQGQTLGLNVDDQHVYPWVDSYIDLVIKEAQETYNISLNELHRGGYRLVVNIDNIIQEIAFEQFKHDTYFPGSTEGTEGAFIMIEQATGKIKAVIGGRDYQLGDMNRVTVPRQPGSTLKPLAVYGPAMMQDYHPYSLIRDEKIDYDGYVASNYDGLYDGEVTIYEAIVTSKNAPAVWLLNEIGILYAKEYLEAMNLYIDDVGLAIALGGLETGLSPLEMAAGYQAFAHDGRAIQPYTIERIYNQDEELIAKRSDKHYEVFSSQVAWNMTEILQATVQTGTAQPGEYAKSLAGKTGSTQHPHVPGEYKDAWFVGYTPEYVSALWMGYDRSDQHHYLTGGSEYPTKLTKAILTEMDKRLSLVADFRQPDHVESVPRPIRLPEITDVQASYTFGGWSLIKGELKWSGSSDTRVVYHIYRQQRDRDEKIGEVVGETTYTIEDVSIFKTSYFYIVPYDPLTGREGKPSEVIELSL